MGKRGKKENRKIVHTPIQGEDKSASTGYIPRSSCWKSSPRWRDDVRRLVGNKAEWNPMDSKTSGSLSLNTLKAKKELAIFLHETYKLLDPLESKLVNSTRNPSRMTINEYIQFYVKLIDGIKQENVRKSFYVSSIGSAKFALDMEFTSDTISSLGQPFCMTLENMMETFTTLQGETITTKAMEQYGITYFQIERLMAWSVAYISYVYNFANENSFDSQLELNFGLDGDGLNEEMKRLIVLLKDVSETDDVEEIIDNSDLDDGLKMMLVMNEDSNLDNVINQYENEYIPISSRIIVIESKMYNLLSKSVRDETYYDVFYRIGGWLIRKLSFINERIVSSSRTCSVIDLFCKSIQSIRNDKQLLFYSLITMNQEDIYNGSECLQEFKMNLEGLYNICFTTSYYNERRLERLNSMVWNDGIDLFVGIDYPSYTIEKRNYRYEKYPYNLQYTSCWKYAKIFTDNGLKFMLKLNTIFRNE